jgi:hypothetical protein
MVKGQHPASVKEATASILPVWLDAFKVLLALDPLHDVSGANWDGLALRVQVFRVRSHPPHPHAALTPHRTRRSTLSTHPSRARSRRCSPSSSRSRCTTCRHSIPPLRTTTCPPPRRRRLHRPRTASPPRSRSSRRALSTSSQAPGARRVSAGRGSPRRATCRRWPARWSAGRR